MRNVFYEDWSVNSENLSEKQVFSQAQTQPQDPFDFYNKMIYRELT